MAFSVKIQTEDFCTKTEWASLAATGTTGAVVTFVGLVREFQQSQPLTLSHYPGMTEKVLNALLGSAQERWPLIAARVVHRVGELAPGEQIVFVGVASAHRKAAFAATEFLIDQLKTQAPFWKKEGDKWVEAKDEDQQHANQWLSEPDEMA